MKKFSIRRTEFHILHRVNQYEFDVTDQEQWNLLKSGLIREDLPQVAPGDINGLVYFFHADPDRFENTDRFDLWRYTALP